MDELLELMNDDAVDPQSAVHQLEDDSDEIQEEIPKGHIPRTRTCNKRDRPEEDRASSTRAYKKQSKPSNRQHKANLAEASVDDRLGIRMSNRLVSSNDLSELITDYTYHSPSVLSAMTLQHLNLLLQDPTRIIDAATVAGKTESLVTIGIVFSNTGTRISSNGGAFSVLTIGNLNSGPCLTIFLFGEAYGKYCTSCKQGKVIALLSPTLLPANRRDGDNRESNSNTVSFSVYNASQIKIVANARDYGICKATTSSRVKQSDGKWAVIAGKPCKHYVNREISEYCEYHRKNRQSGMRQGPNKFQQLRAIHQETAPMVVATPARRGNLIGSNTSTKPNRFLNHTSFNNDRSRILQAKPCSNTGSGSVMPSIGGNCGNIPKHMTRQLPNKFLPKSATSKGKDRRIRGTTKLESFDHENRRAGSTVYSVSANEHPADPSRTRSKTSVSRTNWMEEAAAATKKRGPLHMGGGRRGFSLSQFQEKRRTSTAGNASFVTPANRNRKTASINTVGLGYDGTVFVPKENKILFQQSASIQEIPAKRMVTPINESDRTKQLRQQQAEVAQRLQESTTKEKSSGLSSALVNSSNVKQSSRCRKGVTSEKGRKSDNCEVDAFLAAMGGAVDEDKVRSAKSRFANEVAADEYVKNRRKLLELEKLEASNESRNKKKHQNAEQRMTKNWYCFNCRQTYNQRPGRCISSNHNVKNRFGLKESTSKDEERNALHKKSVQDGGLHLGSGIEWRDSGRFRT